MLPNKLLIGITAAMLFTIFSLSSAKAQGITDVATVQDRKIFYLDSGFVGRSVSLELFDGKFTISWEAEDLKGSNILYVEIEKSSTSSVGGVLLGEEVLHIIWSDPYLLSERGVKVSSSITSNDPWKQTAIYQQVAGTWKEAAGSRVYGHARARVAEKPSTYMRQGDASWYKYKNCRCAASVDFPKGTRVLVTRKDKPEKFTVVRINDYGPERNIFPKRAIDLDAVAFAELASTRAGVIEVTIEPLDEKHPLYAMADAMPSQNKEQLASN